MPSAAFELTVIAVLLRCLHTSLGGNGAREASACTTLAQSHCATAIHALQRAQAITCQSVPADLIIHIVGADSNEGSSLQETLAMFAPLFQDIAITFRCRSLQLALVGPNLDAPLHNTTAKHTHEIENGSTMLVEITYWCGFYHECTSDSSAMTSTPHMALLYNAGIWGYGSWRPTLQRLLSAPCQPTSLHIVVITSYCASEASDDCDVIGDVLSATASSASATGRAQWLWRSELNPHRCSLPRDRRGNSSRHDQFSSHHWQCLSL